MAKTKKVSDSYTAYAKPGAKLKKGANGLMSTTTPRMRASRARVAGERAEAPMRRRARAAAAMASAPTMKKGGSFPDLNKDGKVTKADILKGRGVIAKGGSKVKKAQMGKNITGNVPKGVKVDTAGTINKYRKIFGMSPSKKGVDFKPKTSSKRGKNVLMKTGGKTKKMMGGGKCRGGCY